MAKSDKFETLYIPLTVLRIKIKIEFDHSFNKKEKEKWRIYLKSKNSNRIILVDFELKWAHVV